MSEAWARSHRRGGGSSVAQLLTFAPKGEQPVPDELDVLDVELAAEEQPEPAEQVELWLDTQLAQPVVERRISLREQTVLDVHALALQRRLWWCRCAERGRAERRRAERRRAERRRAECRRYLGRHGRRRPPLKPFGDRLHEA